MKYRLRKYLVGVQMPTDYGTVPLEYVEKTVASLIPSEVGATLTITRTE